MLALLERNAREVGLTYDLREHRVREHRQELVGVERHCCSVGDMLERFRAACSSGSRFGLGIIRRGRRSVSGGAVSRVIASSPELTVGGKGAFLTGYRDVGPGIIRWGQERASDRPGNYPSGAKERYGQDWWCWPWNDPSAGAGPGFVGISKVSGCMVLKMSGFMDRTMRPVNP